MLKPCFSQDLLRAIREDLRHSNSGLKEDSSHASICGKEGCLSLPLKESEHHTGRKGWPRWKSCLASGRGDNPIRLKPLRQLDSSVRLHSTNRMFMDLWHVTAGIVGLIVGIIFTYLLMAAKLSHVRDNLAITTRTMKKSSGGSRSPVSHW